MAKRRGNNEGSIYQRSNGRWVAQIRIDGKRLAKSFGTQKRMPDLDQANARSDRERFVLGCSQNHNERISRPMVQRY